MRSTEHQLAARSGKRKFLIVVLVFLSASLSGACATFILAPEVLLGWWPDHPWTIDGTVLAEQGIVGSYVLHGRPDADEKLERVQGATVFLAYDEHGSNTVGGTKTTTDERGHYSLTVNHRGHYYLVVKKDGYADLVRFMGIGPMGDYAKNTVILKKQ
ncbi:MAG TPA: carboxypeptidase-like regulatory domain-containing protein [Gemmataceae bacterium]|nr:carboxypeptidase-like regulatory domain-containing protein [Gemmataceae bacterium]